jgi:hypothetical protein
MISVDINQSKNSDNIFAPIDVIHKVEEAKKSFDLIIEFVREVIEHVDSEDFDRIRSHQTDIRTEDSAFIVTPAFDEE